MEKWAERIKGKMCFSLNRFSESITLSSVNYNDYHGRVKDAYMDKRGQRNVITITTDTGHGQKFDSEMEVSSDVNMLINFERGFSKWAIILNDKDIFKMKNCNLCLSRCKKEAPCELFDSVLQIYTKGVTMK